MQIVEKLYRLPSGSALLLSDVRAVMVWQTAKNCPRPYVTLILPFNHIEGVYFDDNTEAIAFADTIRPLIDEARAAANGIAPQFLNPDGAR